MKRFLFCVLVMCLVACTKSRPGPRSAGAPPPVAQPPPAPPQPQPFPWLTNGVPPLLTPQGWGIPLPGLKPSTANSWSQVEWQVVQRVNGFRARGAFCGGRFYPPTHALRANAALHNAARGHSWDMGRRDFYDHATPEGHGPSDRARAAGYPTGVAENIHVGIAAVNRVVDDWMHSEGHCRNFMNSSYREIGVGHAHVQGSRYTHYWTANMGRGR